MTKEELEREADEYAIENYERCIYDDVIGWETDYEARKQAYIAGAEPREKRIEELEATNKKISDECHKLVDSLEKEQKENAEPRTRVRELEQQIKKMKRPWNCKKFGSCKLSICPCDRWEIKENAELKKQLEMSNKVYNDNLDYSHHIEEQFTKAKELLKELVTLDKYYHWNLQLAHDAEQFLKDIELRG